MTETYTQHSVPTPALGSVPHAGAAAPGAAGLARLPTIALRRAVLAGGAALALAAGTAAAARTPAADPDGALAALCADLDALQRQIDGLFPADWARLLVLALAAAALAALWPAIRLARTPPSLLLKVFSDER